MPRKHPPSIPATEILRYCEKWSTNVLWPAPVDERLSALVALAVKEGEPDSLTRSELLASLVLAALPSGESLRDMLSAYRKATVGDSIVRDRDDRRRPVNVIVLGDRKPGRRR